MPSEQAMPTLTQVQQYLDGNLDLRSAVGVTSDDPMPLQSLAQGEYNVNYLFTRPSDKKRFVLRMNMGSQMHLENQITYEMEALQLLEQSRRTPRPYYTDDSRSLLPCGIGVEEWLPGRPLCYETDLLEAARIFADIHAIPANEDSCHLIAPRHPLGAIVDECCDMFAIYRDWSQANPEIIKAVDSMFQHAQKLADDERTMPQAAYRCIVNTEVNSHNFLINDDGRSYLIDWEKPVLSDPAQDLSHFLVPTTTYWKTDTWLTNQQMDTFLDEYIRAIDGRFPTSEIHKQLHAYLTVTCLRGITWCAMAYTEYADNNRPIQNNDTFAKIKEYVSLDFIDAIRQQFYA